MNGFIAVAWAPATGGRPRCSRTLLAVRTHIRWRVPRKRWRGPHPSLDVQVPECVCRHSPRAAAHHSEAGHAGSCSRLERKQRENLTSTKTTHIVLTRKQADTPRRHLRHRGTMTPPDTARRAAPCKASPRCGWPSHLIPPTFGGRRRRPTTRASLRPPTPRWSPPPGGHP